MHRVYLTASPQEAQDVTAAPLFIITDSSVCTGGPVSGTEEAYTVYKLYGCAFVPKNADDKQIHGIRSKFMAN